MTTKEEPAPAEAEAPPAAKRRFGWISLSLSAFVMSVTITLINAFYALQGAELVIQPPKQVLLYRDGEGEGSVLAFTLRTDIINAASGHGDVLVEAELVPKVGAPNFGFQGMTTPVFTQTSTEAAKSCQLGARCIALPGLLIVERSDQVIDMPGGAAKAINLSFPAATWNCEGDARQCEAYGTFDKAVDALAAAPLDLRLLLHFHADGDRQITCRGGKIDAAYLRRVGWISLSCDETKVAGAPFL